MKLTNEELEYYKYEATMHENYLWTGSELLSFLDHIDALTAELDHSQRNMQMITTEYWRMRQKNEEMCKYIGDKTFDDLSAANNKLEALTEDYGDALCKIEGLEQTLKSIWMYSTGDDHQWRQAILKKVEVTLNPKNKEKEG